MQDLALKSSQINLSDTLKGNLSNILPILTSILPLLDQSGELQNMIGEMNLDKLGNFLLNDLKGFFEQFHSTEDFPEEYKTLFSGIYNVINQISSLVNSASDNLKNVDLSFLEPIKDAIMNINGTELKEKQNQALSQIDSIKTELSNIIQKWLKDKNLPKDIIDKLENLKTLLVNFDIKDLMLEEKINSKIEKIKALDQDILKELILQKLLSNTNKDKLNKLKEK